MSSDPKILGLALLGGLIPSIFWLWFWLREDKEDPEPKIILTISFIMGMIAVIFVLPIQEFLQTHITSHLWQVISFASVEEIMKLLTIFVILFNTRYINKPIDWAIYIITAALGFAAIENILFLIKPLSLNQSINGLITSQLRFLGSTLLHTVSSGLIGIFLGLSFYLSKNYKKIYLFFGIIFAIALHSTFNFFIMNISGKEFLKVFAFLWVTTIINLLLFEKLRRMSGEN
ncbi:PrsW family intramembrane metalloprotease [Candidatus Nomurabacteria bacterium]|nr:PrsW family intramembrane metalloprotease [Candidatus Nomurabacteria bacterium]